VCSEVVFAANTHVHADHITGSGEIKKRVPTCRSVIAEVSQAKADVKINAGDKLKFGRFELEVRATPGHTDGEYPLHTSLCWGLPRVSLLSQR
jgi:sulfur dioxygenase